VEFEDCYQRLVEIEIDNIRIPVIHSDNLKTHKKALGHHQDLADLDKLENKKPNYDCMASLLTRDIAASLSKHWQDPKN